MFQFLLYFAPSYFFRVSSQAVIAQQFSTDLTEEKIQGHNAFIFPLLETAQVIPLKLGRYIYSPFLRWEHNFGELLLAFCLFLLSSFKQLLLNTIGGRMMFCTEMAPLGNESLQSSTTRNKPTVEHYLCTCLHLPV